MVDQQRLQAALREFAHMLVRRYEIGDVLYRLSDTVSDVLGVAGSGVSVLDNDVVRFVTATSDAVAEVERLQDHFEQGPCRDAAATTPGSSLTISRRTMSGGPSSLRRRSTVVCRRC